MAMTGYYCVHASLLKSGTKCSTRYHCAWFGGSILQETSPCHCKCNAVRGFMSGCILFPFFSQTEDTDLFRTTREVTALLQQIMWKWCTQRQQDLKSKGTYIMNPLKVNHSHSSWGLRTGLWTLLWEFVCPQNLGGLVPQMRVCNIHDQEWREKKKRKEKRSSTLHHHFSNVFKNHLPMIRS